MNVDFIRTGEYITIHSFVPKVLLNSINLIRKFIFEKQENHSKLTNRKNPLGNRSASRTPSSGSTKLFGLKAIIPYKTLPESPIITHSPFSNQACLANHKSQTIH